MPASHVAVPLQREHAGASRSAKLVPLNKQRPNRGPMSRIRILLCALLACSALLSATLGASQALASANQKLYFEAPMDLLNPSTRPHALVQLQELGVHALRIELNWY